MGPDPALNPDLIQAQSFTSSFRGYDQAEVRSFLGRVASEVRALRERVDQLDSAWHSAEERAARPPVIDEETLMAAVGDETASIIRTARSAAAEIRAKAIEDSEKVVAEATAEAERIRSEVQAEAEQESRQAHESAERVVAAARNESAQYVERARVEADGVRLQAEQDRALTIEGANATRERILEDLVRRRKVAEVQIEQLRAGRERLMESYAVVRRTLEEVQSELSRADAEARAAADDVGRRLRGHDPATVPTTGRRPDDNPPTDETPTDEPPSDEGPSDKGPSDDATERDGSDEAGSIESEGGAGETEPASDAPEDAAQREVADEAGTSAVDELFARIRSTGRSKSSRRNAKASTASGPDTTASVAADPESVATRTLTIESHAEAAGDEVAADEGDPAPTLDSDEMLLQRREAVLGDLEAGLTRKLKRALQDEQNDLLDRLRSHKGAPKASDLLPPLDDHLRVYEKAATPTLEEAGRAGVAFAEDLLEVSVAGSSSPALDDLAAEAATGIVEPLRRRLEQAVTSTGGDDQTALVESVGAAYREWKSQRIERISGDVLHAAFARGTWNATPPSATMRWVVDDVDGPCPDCDDDALAGLIPKGEDFPTGQQHPPAHSGCRCLLLPSAT